MTKSKKDNYEIQMECCYKALQELRSILGKNYMSYLTSFESN